MRRALGSIGRSKSTVSRISTMTIGESDCSLSATSFGSVTLQRPQSPLNSRTTMSRCATCVQQHWESCEHVPGLSNSNVWFARIRTRWHARHSVASRCGRRYLWRDQLRLKVRHHRRPECALCRDHRCFEVRQSRCLGSCRRIGASLSVSLKLGSSPCYRAIVTVTGEFWITVSATLPTKIPDSPERPWLPMMTLSMSFSLAYPTIASPG